MNVKNVYVDKAPDNCGQCMFLYALGGGEGFYGCHLKIIQVDINTRPDWCPLTTENETIEKIVKVLTHVGLGISAHFCDWNRPSQWQNRPTPDEVEKWVIDKIKETEAA